MLSLMASDICDIMGTSGNWLEKNETVYCMSRMVNESKLEIICDEYGVSAIVRRYIYDISNTGVTAAQSGTGPNLQQINNPFTFIQNGDNNTQIGYIANQTIVKK